jgi:peroxiredoxin Q/BCP
MGDSKPSGGRVEVGDVAPDFTLPSHSGEQVSLRDVLQRGPVVLYFYPKDETPGCTAEACSFRDSYEAFRDAGAEVIGVSSDSIDAHERFASRHGLPFILLADAGGAVRKRYGVRATLALIPGRVTFVIDREGVVRHVFSSQTNMQRHVDEALAALGEIASRT